MKVVINNDTGRNIGLFGHYFRQGVTRTLTGLDKLQVELLADSDLHIADVDNFDVEKYNKDFLRLLANIKEIEGRGEMTKAELKLALNPSEHEVEQQEGDE